MKILKIVLTVIVAFLSIAAGLAKLMGAPQEVVFLSSLGFNSSMILLFGAAQAVGAILTALPVTRLFGLIIIFLGFLLSAILVFVSGKLVFGMVSLLPVIVVAFLAYQLIQSTYNRPRERLL